MAGCRDAQPGLAPTPPWADALARDPSLLVVNAAPDPSRPAYTLEPPVIRVGGRNDENLYEELWVVRDAVLSDSGELYVSMDNGREVRVFDGDRFVRTVGRSGEGPGEFHSADRLVSLPGDTLLLYDRRAMRITAYSDGRQYARQVRSRTRYVTCCLRDGRYLVRDFFIPTLAWPDTAAHTQWRLASAWETGGAEHPFLTAPFHDPDVHVPVQGLAGGFVARMPPHRLDPPFGVRAHVDMSFDRIFYGRGDRLEYGVYSPDMGLLRVVRADLPRPTVRPPDAAAARHSFLTSGRREGYEGWYDRAWRSVHVPDSMPAFRRLEAEESGTVWLERYPPPGDTASRPWWVAFDPEGRLLGTVTLPRGHVVVRFSRGHVILRHEDPALGFHVVSVHRLRRVRP